MDVLICATWTEAKDWIPGTERRACFDCETEIAVAPSGQQLLREQPELEPMCPACARTRFLTDPSPELALLNDTQKRELRRALTDDA